MTNPAENGGDALDITESENGDSTSSELERLNENISPAPSRGDTPTERGIARTKRQEEKILRTIEQTKALGANTLDLSNHGLLIVPSELLELTNLEHLYLEGNQLTSIPDDFFDRLPSLKWLDLRHNYLIRLPSVFTGRHQNLRNLLLEGNNLRTLPLELGMIKTLNGLNITNNPLEFPPATVIEKGTAEILKFLREMMAAKNSGRLLNGRGSFLPGGGVKKTVSFHTELKDHYTLPHLRNTSKMPVSAGVRIGLKQSGTVKFRSAGLPSRQTIHLGSRPSSFESHSSDQYPEKELADIEVYLRELYKGLVTIPLSPSGEEEHYVNVSDVYFNIAFRKVEITDLDNGEDNASSDPPHENEPFISKNQATTNEKNQFSPILMFGDCGSGKSTWCKHLVDCWLQRSDINDVNIQVLNLPNLRNINILLYLPLQFSDRGISFQELMNKHLFKERSTYLEFAMNYIKRNAPKVLVVMDGLDIIRENITPISDILNHKHMSSCHVIVTSRPASLKLLQDKCHVKIEQMRLFRVRKMTPEDSKACAISMLKHLNHLHGKNFNVVSFWRFTEHLQVNHLLRVPYICLVLLHMWIKNENCFTKITDILLDIIHHYLRRATLDQQRKIYIENASDKKSKDVQKYITKLKKWNLPKEHGYLLYVLCRLAAQKFNSATERESSKLKIPQHVLITDEDDLDLQRICDIGLLTESLSLSDDHKVSNMAFPDSIIYEYFVSIFIALQDGKGYDLIVSSEKACLQNSMIIHILFQFTDTLIKDMMDKASKSFGKQSTNTMGHGKSKDLNEKCKYRITCSDKTSVPWLQLLTDNNTLQSNQLLFLSTALQCIDKVTSLELENHENNENLVLQLPCLSVLELLKLDINKCTLLLCKEWDNRVPKKLKEVAIRSVMVNTGTLSLLTKTLGLCPELERLELFPSAIWSDDNDSLLKRPELANYSWNELSKHIQNNKKLKTLELNGLNLIGVVDTFLSRCNRYENLETLILKNISSISQEQSPLFHSSDTDRGSDDDVNKNKIKLKLTQLNLKRLKLLHSPIDFLADTRNKGKSIKNNLKVLSISALQMPEKLWETLGSQISTLTLSEFHLSSVNPGQSLQILLDSIGMCNNLECLSLYKIETGKMNPNFSFLANIKQLSQFELREMQLDRSSSFSLFKEICRCKQLQRLSLCNIEVEEIPETMQKLTKLSVLTVDRVTIKGESSSLCDFLNAFSNCENLKTLYVSKEIAVSIPSKLLSALKVI